MFERKNKSPKFIITLPDAATRRAEVLGERAAAANDAEQEANGAEEKEKGFSAIELIDKIPLTAKLQPIANPVPLNPIQIIPGLSEETGGLLLPKISESGQNHGSNMPNPKPFSPIFIRWALS